MKTIIPKWFVIYATLVLTIYFGSAVYFMTCKVAPRNAKHERQIKQWEQKYNEEKVNCEKRYEEEIAQKEKIFKEHPRMRKYFR